MRSGQVPPFNLARLTVSLPFVQPEQACLQVGDGDRVLSAGELLVERLEGAQGEGQDVVDLAAVDPHLFDGPALADEDHCVWHDTDVGCFGDGVARYVSLRCVCVGKGSVPELAGLFGREQLWGVVDVGRPTKCHSFPPPGSF